MVRRCQWNGVARRSTIAGVRDRGEDFKANLSRRPWWQQGYGDNASADEAEHRRKELKDKILAGVQDFNVKRYRKSDEELKSIKNKQVRAYYEAQNQKLNDWAEVDRLVWSLADDVVDSTNPDADRDGIVDNDTPLKLTSDDLEAFLPPEERKKRAKDRRIAKRALNVCCTNPLSNVLEVY